MSDRQPLKLSSSEFSSFFSDNSDFDLLTHDFFDPHARVRLQGAPFSLEQTLETLRPYQRLMRLFPQNNNSVARAANQVESIVKALIDRGLDSAHSVAAKSEHRFVQENKDLMDGDEELARAIHRRAVQIKAAVRHLFANVRDVVGSPYSRQSLAKYTEPELIEYFESIPSYQSLFGSLDYIEVPECASIFSPAAYFLDIMRITDEYITYYNQETIPEGYKLEERRPDLFSQVKLSCEETLGTLPYVSLIEGIFFEKLKNDLNQDPYEVVAAAPYPFNLPFNRPLVETVTYLNKLGTTISEAGRAMLAPIPSALGFDTIELARAYLGLSAEQVEEVITINASDASIGAQYGLDTISSGLPTPGPGQITYTKDDTLASGGNNQLGKLLVIGQQFASQGQIRTVVKIINDASVEVNIPWVSSGTNVSYSIYGYPTDLTRDAMFRDRVGDMPYQDLESLINQELSDSEFESGAAGAFFINNTGEGLDPLEIVRGDAEQGNVYSRLLNLSQKRLDRLSRFIRLSRLTQIDYAMLDWLMRICEASEITNDLIIALAGIKELAATAELDLKTVASLVGIFKTSGKGNGLVPKDPFDETFNNPSLLNGEDPYTVARPIPFDPARPLSWAPQGLSGDGIQGQLRGATQTTAVLADNASSNDGAYVGLQLNITNGPGANQAAIVQAYNGSSKTATIYSSWSTTPTDQSSYKLAIATGLEERLAAALQAKKTDLPVLGTYYQAGNAPNDLTLLLTTETLTGLWRLAKLAWTYRLTIAEYLLARKLAGLNAEYASSVSTALTEAQDAVAIVTWLQARNMSAYELAYVLNGQRSRYLRPAFNPEDVPSILANLASSSVSTHFTVNTLTQAGFTEEEASQIVAGLAEQNIIDDLGLIVPHDELFAQTSANFPVTESGLQEGGTLSEAEAKATINELTIQRPPVLQVTGQPDSYALTANYRPGSSLDYLFVGDADVANKQAFVSSYLDIVAAKTNFQLLSPLFSISATKTFQSDDIGPAQSQAVFDRLQATSPAVILPGSEADIGHLSANYDGSTTDWNLFTSSATGQNNTIAAYDATTQTATVEQNWTQAIPDAFTYYRIVRSQQSGTAQSGTATSITLAASASADDEAYTGFYVLVTGGQGAGQSRLITAYNGQTKVATVDEEWEPPNSSSTYKVESLILAGNADGGTANTIILGSKASNQNDDYQGLTIRLLADPSATSKTAEVVTVLNTYQDQIVKLIQTLDTTAQSQQSAVLNGINNVLTLSPSAIETGLPYATTDYVQTRQLVPVFLGGNNEQNQQTATEVLDGLSRFDLLRNKINFQDEVWAAIARRPDLFDITRTSPLVYHDVLRLGAFKDFTNTIGDDGTGVADYLAIWSDVIPIEKRSALHNLTGWPAEQITNLDTFLSDNVSGYAGLDRLDGLLRLNAPFAIASNIAADSQYLISLAGLISSPPLGNIGGNIDTVLWSRQNDVSAASLTVVAARYRDGDFDEVADRLRRSVDSAKRNALMGYLIWTLNKTNPTIKQPSDLFQFLLIDVETSGCDTTSPIAQGIDSVQLYMQRCRMALEPGVTTDNIPTIWWEWMSAYRVWEANRKIFLYPENYIVPSQRKSASPEFQQLIDDLMQSRPTEENIAFAMVKYLDSFEALAKLVSVGSYKAFQAELEGGQIDETAVIVGRTNTSPYQYYTRNFTRSTLPEMAGLDRQTIAWTPWRKIDATIDAQFVTPVWAFDRLFLFWNEIKPIKSSAVSTDGSGNSLNVASNTESFWQATLKYTFPTSTGDWLPAQALNESMPIRIAPNDYGPANNENIAKAFLNEQHYWHQPFAQHIPRGLPGTGSLSFAAGSTAATGTRTRLDKQIQPGDFIYTAGQRLQVESIDAYNQTLTTKLPFKLSGMDIPFKVIPKDPKQTRYSPYTGLGKVTIVADFNVVNGEGTEFTIDFTVGDYIQIGAETRTVKAIASDTELVVDRSWTVSILQDGPGTITIFSGIQNVEGQDTNFKKEDEGKLLVVEGQARTIVVVLSTTSLLVEEAFDIPQTTTPYKIATEQDSQDTGTTEDGPGTVTIFPGIQNVDGQGTDFKNEDQGKWLVVEGQSRIIAVVLSSTSLLVEEAFDVSQVTTTSYKITTEQESTVTIFPGIQNVEGQGTNFKKEDQGELLVVEGQARTIVVVLSTTSLLVEEAFDISEQMTVPYKVGKLPGDYKVSLQIDGAERLIVLYGPNLDIEGNYGAEHDPPDDNNPGEDPFISSKYTYNAEIYDTLTTIDAVKNAPSQPQHGDVTGLKLLMLNAALNQQNSRLYAPCYDPSTVSTSSLFRATVDRVNNLLFASKNERPMVSLYWGNSSQGTTVNQNNYAVSDLPLLYHINSQSAVLLGVGNQVSWYLFNDNNNSFFITLDNDRPVPVGQSTILKPVWERDASDNLQMVFGPYSLENTPFETMKFRVMRLSTDVAPALQQRLLVGLDILLSLDSQFLPESPFDQYYQTPEGEPPPSLDSNYLPSDIMDFTGAYGLYFWEIFFHSPLLVAEWVKSNQDFQTAKRWYEYIFNPTATDDGTGATGSDRYWQFRPFREDMTIPSLRETLTNVFEINKYNNDPFNPDAIAQLRISAYAKTTVLKYVDNLIQWADSLFTLDTRESITQATNLYVLARDLLGKKPEVVGVFEQPNPLTFNEIKEQYPNGIPQFLIDLENTSLVPTTGQGQRYADVPVNDIHAYFGVPENADLMLYWDTIDDRLYKIRHCMNINGVVRQLSLFAPPIDPAALIAGFGSSGSISAGAGFNPYPIPNYRFSYLISMAQSLADRVIQFGGALLSALERKDGEALAQLNLTQEAQLLQLTTQVKEDSIEQIDKQIESLQQAEAGARAREDHYKHLLERDMLPEEISELVLRSTSAVFSGTSSVLGAAASVSAAVPNVGSPFAMTYGGVQIGASLQNASAWTEVVAKLLDTTANILATVANHKRRVEEWELQKTLAGFDVAQFNAQIEATTIQKQIAQRDLQIHNTQIDQNNAVQTFYQDKFTNEGLYSWMAGRLSTSYFQAYSLALEFARMAQSAYQFEYRTNTTFIAASYWDDLRKGLTAGESLSLALNQMEGAYVRNSSRSQEITKIVSLRQHDPVALLTFVTTGETLFDLSERIFDQDFPGQYKRRIKSVKVSIPALVGPYQNIHATLTQTANRVVLKPDLNAVKFLLGDDIEVSEGTIEHNARAFQKISLSQGQGDSGVFEPNSNDPLYLPFEQTGVISSWRLSMPRANNPIDFNGISDVILEIQYTALDGGDAFRSQVANLPQLREREWTQLIQPAQQYQTNWFEFMSGPVSGEEQTLSFPAQTPILPNLTKAEILGFYLRLKVSEGTQLGSQNPYISVTIGAAEADPLLPAPDGTALHLFVRPEPLKTSSTAARIDFDLRPSYTPSQLRTENGMRLNPDVLKDVEIVLFLSGKY